MQSLEPNKKIRVLLVDDHILMRMGVSFALNNQPDMTVVAEAEDGTEAADAYRKHKPDVVVLDLRMPKRNGVETIKALREEFGAIRVLILSTYCTGDEIGSAIQSGARGFIAKDTPLAGLFEAIRHIHAGEQYFPTDVAGRLAANVASHLSPREIDVLKLLGKGFSNKEIGSQLNVAEATVKIHVTNIFSKLGVSDRMQAVLSAIKRGMIHVE